MDRATYVISGRLDHAPRPKDVPDAQLPALLDQTDVRQILHVTFGSVLTSIAEPAVKRRTISHRASFIATGSAIT